MPGTFACGSQVISSLVAGMAAMERESITAAPGRAARPKQSVVAAPGATCLTATDASGGGLVILAEAEIVRRISVL